MATPHPEPLFQPGDRVLRSGQRDSVGQILAEGEYDAGEFWYRVAFGRVNQECAESGLEPFGDESPSIESLALAGRWGTLEAFRRAMAVERMQSDDRSTLFSYRSERILFAPHQYKPLLKFLDSPHRGLLIADEVGLGKTIESGLILAELEARQEVARVLVVCPSRLREKWRSELARKFGQEFDILEGRDIREFVTRQKEQPGRLPKLRGIISQQSLRRRELLEEFLSVTPRFDLVIVDEAHHGRNPSTQTSQMVQSLGGHADAMLLLTATPIHLGSEDLRTLLAALRPRDFGDGTAFVDALEKNRPILEASAQVRGRRHEDIPEIAQRISRACSAGAAMDPLAKQLLHDLQESPPQSADQWTEVERRIEELHFLAPFLTRTRKRDVQEHAPVRRAHVIRCAWSDEEHSAYAQFTGGQLGQDGWPTQKLGLGAIQRARQAASSLPAAMGWWDPDADADPAESSDLDVADGQAADVDEIGLPGAFDPPTADAKFECLVDLLRRVELEEPGTKVLLFTFFVGTSRYLEQQLSARGISALRIAGDVRSTPKLPATDDRGRVVRAFREDPIVRVLVSTEVGSEGLDFQFCHHLVNYDLPWNPMVVEQRIGRIDRFGQAANVVHIHNFVVEGTVEERILDRLYNRIRIFEESLGSLDTILGQVVEELTSDFVRGTLTLEEASKKLDEAAQALDRQRQQMRELEGRASELLGHEDYVRAELDRVQRLGRYVTDSGIHAVVEGFLEGLRTPGRVSKEGEGIWSMPVDEHVFAAVRIAVSTDAEVDLRTRLRGRDRLLFALDGQIAYENPIVELLNIRHPIVRTACEHLSPLRSDAIACTGQAVLRLSTSEFPEIPAGHVVLVVRRQEVRGIRARRFLEAVAVHLESGDLLESESGELVLHLALTRGERWFGDVGAPSLRRDTWQQVISEARRRNRDLDRREAAENDARYLQTRAMHDRELAWRLERLGRQIETNKERGRGERIIRMFEAQEARTRSDHEARIAELEKDRQTSVDLSEPIAGCLVRVERRGD